MLGSNRRRFTYAYKIPAEAKAVVILYLQFSGKEFFFTDEAGNKLRSSFNFCYFCPRQLSRETFCSFLWRREIGG